MKCVICRHSETHPGKVTVTLTRGESTIIIKNVSADVCDNCSEYYLSDTITEQILTMAEEAINKGVEVEILRMAA